MKESSNSRLFEFEWVDRCSVLWKRKTIKKMTKQAKKWFLSFEKPLRFQESFPLFILFKRNLFSPTVANILATVLVYYMWYIEHFIENFLYLLQNSVFFYEKELRECCS